MKYYIGVDIGTTATKTVAFDEKGIVLDSSAANYDMLHPNEGYSEQRPDDILTAVLHTLNTLVNRNNTMVPAFVSFSAAMHSVIAVDESGTALTNSITWADNRAQDIARRIHAQGDAARLYQLSGVPVHAMSPLCKLIWLRENEPALFKKAYKFIGIKEYIFYKLFGTFEADTSIASATGLLETSTLQWSEALLQYAGMNKSRLSAVAPVTKPFFYKNILAGFTFPETVPFIIGGSDGALSNLGSGATGPNEMAVTIGTSGAVRMVTHTPWSDPLMRTFCYHLEGERYIAGGANNNGAVVLQWLKEDILRTDTSMDALLSEAAQLPPGCNGLLLLPYLMGERAPYWNSRAQGVFFGLRITHSHAHLVRAAMEGVIFAMYSIGKVLMEHRNVKQILASGGFTQSAPWVQLLADVFGIPVITTDGPEASAKGAVILGATALKLEWEQQEAPGKTYLPDASKFDDYQKIFARFERLYKLLRPEMDDALIP